MTGQDDAFAELCETLRAEAVEQVERIGAVLVRLERDPDHEERDALLDDALREAHNLKGAAGSMGFGLAARLAHAIETAVSVMRDTAPSTNATAFDSLHAALSAVGETLAVDPATESIPHVDEVIRELDAQGQTPDADVSEAAAAGRPSATATRVGRSTRGRPHTTVTATGSPRTRSDRPSSSVRIRGSSDSTRPSSTQTLRVSVEKLHVLMTQVGELLGARVRAEQRLTELRLLQDREEARLRRMTGSRSSLRDLAHPVLAASSDHDPRAATVVRQLLDGYGAEIDRQRTLVRGLRESVRALEADALQATILSGELQEDIRRIQAFPLWSVLEPLPRAVRNMGREAGKEVELMIEGAELELDKKVLEALRDPLYHLLRNAVDHGVESPLERSDAGKPPRGRIRITAEHRGSSIIITISDDGPGIDFERVRETAIQRGVVDSEQALDLTDDQVLELLFRPGFTTRTEVTGLSGRGFGLDSVREAVEALRGTVSISAETGRGTSIAISLPLTIYVVQALVLRVGTYLVALPISAVHRIVRVHTDSMFTVENVEAAVIDGRTTAIVSLASLLDVEDDPDEGRERVPVVVVGAGDSRFGVAVDEIVGDQTLLAKKLEPPIIRIRNIAGASILADGTIVVMLNPVDLLRSIPRLRSAPSHVEPDVRTRRILLADDSLTTRALERSILEVAGFDVIAVADGREALDRLRDDPGFDIVVSDVSMPNMTGLELCTEVRQIEALRTTPILLVSSQGSPDDQRRGLEAGADAYLVKSEFDHQLLVATVNRLLGQS